MKLAEAYVNIKANTAHFKRGIAASKTSLGKFASAAPGLLKGVTKALAGMTAAAIAAQAAFTILAVKTTQVFARFQHSMANVSTMITKDWKKTTAGLSAGVREITKSIPQSTEELTVALYDILSASVPVNQSLSALGTSARAAIAGMSTTQNAANLLTGTINGLGLEFSDMEKISDLAFSTVARGKISFEELASSIGRAIPAASKMSADVTELYGGMAFLTKNALSAEMAATALGATYEELSKKSKELKEKLGISVFGAKGEYVGLLNIVGQIAEKLKGLTEEAQVDIFKTMGFERQSARAIVSMTRNLDDFRLTMSQVADSAGATSEAYDKMKETLINQWKLLKNSLSNLWIEIGAGFGDIATDMIKNTKRLVDGIATMIPYWRANRDAAVATFRNIAEIGVKLTGEMLVHLGEMIAGAAKVIWEPLVYYASSAVNRAVLSISERMLDFLAARGIIDSGLDDFYRGLMDKQKDALQEWNTSMKQGLQLGMADYVVSLKNIITQAGGEFSTAFDDILASIESFETGMAGAASETERLGAAINSIPRSLAGLNDLLDKLFPSGLKPPPTTGAGFAKGALRDYREIRSLGQTDKSKYGAVMGGLSGSVPLTSRQSAFDPNIVKERERLSGVMLEIIGRENDAAIAEKERSVDRGIELENMRLAEIRTNGEEIAAFYQEIEDKKIAAAQASAEKWKQIQLNMANVIRSSFEGLFTDMIMGIGKGEDRWKQFGESLKRMLIGLGVKAAFSAILGPAAFAMPFKHGGISPGHIDIPKFQTGGIVQRPTFAAIGEGGPEAVIPLKGGKVPVDIKGSSGGVHVDTFNISFPNANLENMDSAQIQRTMALKLLPALEEAARTGQVNPIMTA